MGSFPFARRYLGNRCFFLFLRLLRCFSSPGSLLAVYVFNRGRRGFSPPGFPIRISMAITPVCGLPWLFAAYRVLLRLLAPGHSPCALIRLIFIPSVGRFPVRRRSFVAFPKTPRSFSPLSRLSASFCLLCPSSSGRFASVSAFPFPFRLPSFAFPSFACRSSACSCVMCGFQGAVN